MANEVKFSQYTNKGSVSGNEKIPTGDTPGVGIFGVSLTPELIAEYAAAQFGGGLPLPRKKIIALHDTANPNIGHDQIIKLLDGRLFGALVLSSGTGETARSTIWGQYSTDKGETWSTLFEITPIIGSETQNVTCSIYQRSNGTLVMIFRRAFSDETAKLFLSKSTDSGLTWTTPTVIYNTSGVYIDPGPDRILKLNNGNLLYPFSQWIPPAEDPLAPNDRGSQLGFYKGLILKSTDDGDTWALQAIEVKSSENLVTQVGLFQFEDVAGVAGQIVMYFRTRGNVVGFSNINAAITVGTEQVSTLVGNNQPHNIRYYREYRALVGLIGRLEDPVRTRLDLVVSYDHGTNWVTKYIIEDNIANDSNSAVTPGPQFIDDDILYVTYYKTTEINTVDGWLLKAPVSFITGNTTTITKTHQYRNSALSSSAKRDNSVAQDKIIDSTHSQIVEVSRPADNNAPYRIILQKPGGGLYSSGVGVLPQDTLIDVFDGNAKMFGFRVDGLMFPGKFAIVKSFADDTEADGAAGLNTGSGAPVGSFFWNVATGSLRFKVSVGTNVYNWQNQAMYATVSTTNATTTTLLSYTLRQQHTNVLLRATITLRNTDNDDSATTIITRTAKRLTGGAVLVGTTTVIQALNGDAGLSSCTADFDVSSNDVRVRVTGIAATNIRWTCKIDDVAN